MFGNNKFKENVSLKTYLPLSHAVATLGLTLTWLSSSAIWQYLASTTRFSIDKCYPWCTSYMVISPDVLLIVREFPCVWAFIWLWIIMGYIDGWYEYGFNDSNMTLTPFCILQEFHLTNKIYILIFLIRNIWDISLMSWFTHKVT